MRYLVTGANGMLASDVLEVFSDLNPIGLTRDDLDITDLESTLSVVKQGDVVINCAAYNKVDEAETYSQLAFKTNSDGPRVLADAVNQRGGKLIHFSSDYVFSGEVHTPHLESERRSPISVYGKSKALGEVNALSAHPLGTYVLRTAWLYGKNGPNFAHTILNRARRGQECLVVTDQIGQPTWTRDLALQARILLERDAPVGVYHATNSGEASWFEFAQQLAILADIPASLIRPTTTKEFVRAAQRPTFSALSHGRWSAVDIEPMRDWKLALSDAFEMGVFEEVEP